MSVFRTAAVLMTAVGLAGGSGSVFAQGSATAPPNTPTEKTIGMPSKPDSAKTEPSLIVKVPRLAAAPASLECREVMTLEIGRNRIVLGQVVAIHVKDEFVDPTGHYIRAEELHAIGRMNGTGAYVKTRAAFFQMPRVKYADWQLEAQKNS